MQLAFAIRYSNIATEAHVVKYGKIRVYFPLLCIIQSLVSGGCGAMAYSKGPGPCGSKRIILGTCLVAYHSKSLWELS